MFVQSAEERSFRVLKRRDLGTAMVLKGTHGRKTSRRQDDSAFREALAALLESPDVELTRRDEETGSCQKLARLVEEEARKNANGAPQTFYFLHENGERFLVVAPTATVLLILDAFLGIDVAKLCGDAALWRDLCESSRKRPDLTELESEIILVEASRLGALNSRWFAPEIAEGTAKPKWKTRFYGRDFQKAADYLDEEKLRWERRTFKLRKRLFTLTVAAPCATFVQTAPAKTDATPIPLPDLDASEKDAARQEIKTIVARVAKGTIAEEEWRSLKPGDVLTTDVPADSLFELLVDDKVVFRVKPGLFQGRPAVQIKERL